MPLVSLSGKGAAEEKGCSCDVISSPCLLDMAVARASIALVGERGKKNLLRTYLHNFL